MSHREKAALQVFLLLAGTMEGIRQTVSRIAELSLDSE